METLGTRAGYEGVEGLVVAVEQERAASTVERGKGGLEVRGRRRGAGSGRTKEVVQGFRGWGAEV